MQELFENFRWLGIALACLTLVGCASANVCSGKTEKQIESEKKADSYQIQADSFRSINDKEQANYYDEKAQNEEWKSIGESDWVTAIILSILGFTCDG